MNNDNKIHFQELLYNVKFCSEIPCPVQSNCPKPDGTPCVMAKHISSHYAGLKPCGTQTKWNTDTVDYRHMVEYGHTLELRHGEIQTWWNLDTVELEYSGTQARWNIDMAEFRHG